MRCLHSQLLLTSKTQYPNFFLHSLTFQIVKAPPYRKGDEIHHTWMKLIHKVVQPCHSQVHQLRLTPWPGPYVFLTNLTLTSH